MGFEYQKRPERRREDEPILPARGQTRRMSAKAAAKLIHAAKKSGAEVRHESGSGLEKPSTGKQMKSCALCDHTAGPSASHACPMCGQQASSGLEKPVDSVQMKGAGTADAAERQADTVGAKIGAQLSGMSVGAGTLSPSAASVADRHVGTSVAGAELRSDANANARAASMGALAVTEGDRVSFAAGRLDGSTSAGRSLVGHELVHVAQQRAHGFGARQGFLGLGGDDGGEGGGNSSGGVMTGMGLAGPGGGGGEGSLRSGPAATEAPSGGETVFGGTIGLPDGAEEYGVHGQGSVEVRVNDNGSVSIEVSGSAKVSLGGLEITFDRRVSIGGLPEPIGSDPPFAPPDAPPLDRGRPACSALKKLKPPPLVSQPTRATCWAAAMSSFMKATGKNGLASSTLVEDILRYYDSTTKPYCLLDLGLDRTGGLPGENRLGAYASLAAAWIPYSGSGRQAWTLIRSRIDSGEPVLIDYEAWSGAAIAMRHVVVAYGYCESVNPDAPETHSLWVVDPDSGLDVRRFKAFLNADMHLGVARSDSPYDGRSMCTTYCSEGCENFGSGPPSCDETYFKCPPPAP